MRVPTIQEDGREQRGARRPDTSGDVPGADDGGGNGQPKGGGMAKWMEDEQNLSTRRGVAWCKRAPAIPRPSLPASPVASRPGLPRCPSSVLPRGPPSRAPPCHLVPGCPVALRPGIPRGPPSRAAPWLPGQGSPVSPRPGLPRGPRPGLPRAPLPGCPSLPAPGSPVPPRPRPPVALRPRKCRGPAGPGSPVAPVSGSPVPRWSEGGAVGGRPGGGRTGDFTRDMFVHGLVQSSPECPPKQYGSESPCRKVGKSN